VSGPVDQLVVRLKHRTAPPAEEAIAASVGGWRVEGVRPGEFAMEVAEGRGEEALASLRQRRDVAFAELEARFHAAEATYEAALLPNDTCLVSTCLLDMDGKTERVRQEEMFRVGAPAAWTVSRGDPRLLVAVLDTGIDTSHPDLKDKIVVGPDFTGDPNPDQTGHGTMVAGIITAQPDNAKGIAGLGWSTRVLSIRVLDHKGDGVAHDIAQGLYYAADYQNQQEGSVRIINLSLQQDHQQANQVSDEVRQAITYAQSKGVLVVAAAGNVAPDAPDLTLATYPADFPGVVSVTSTDANDHLSAFSRRGSWVDLAAPGERVLTTYPGCDCYAMATGTSFATPFVSAAAALVWANRPALTAAQVEARLESTAAVVPGTGTSWRAGRLDVGRALSFGSGGYWLTASDGGIFAFGDARFLGSTGAVALNKPIVGMTATPAGEGYWLVASDGGIFAFGDARFLGSTGAMVLNKPIVGMTASPSGKGYWLVASDGGIFSFGDARFLGSTGAMALNKPIVGMTATPSGKGYWLVASDGGIFSFGDARFLGSTGALVLNKPIVGMAATPSGKGYWFVASDGGIFSFGDARFLGSTAGGPSRSPVAGMVATRSGSGYWVVAADGVVTAFGDAVLLGVPVGPLNRPVVALAAH
jgi:subtilisin family serine protease